MLLHAHIIHLALLTPPPPHHHNLDRRATLANAASLAAVLAAAATAPPRPAVASGGATAGKYTTIPIAKRRYFGRVKQGVFEFLLIGDALKNNDLKSADIDNFFAQTIVTQSERQKTNCAGSLSDACTVKEERSSRWEDMQLAMFLLGNAFRLDSGKPPEKVRQVKEAKVFFKEVENLQRASRGGSSKEAAVHYAAAREALDVFLNDVELPPTVDAVYSQKDSLSVPSLCQGSFCI